MCNISSKELLINEQIREKELRVIGAAGEQLGILPLDKAQKLAIEQNLDLVMIAPQGKPPVCKIMDYGKYRFELSKKEKDLRKNQHQIELKEVRMSLNIDTNDFNTKVNHAIKFLKGGDKVKITIRFRRAREMSHMNLCEDLMGKFKEACSEYGTPEKPGKLEGRNYGIVIAPKVEKAPLKKQKGGASPQKERN